MLVPGKQETGAAAKSRREQRGKVKRKENKIMTERKAQAVVGEARQERRYEMHSAVIKGRSFRS